MHTTIVFTAIAYINSSKTSPWVISVPRDPPLPPSSQVYALHPRGNDPVLSEKLRYLSQPVDNFWLNMGWSIFPTIPGEAFNGENGGPTSGETNSYDRRRLRPYRTWSNCTERTDSCHISECGLTRLGALHERKHSRHREENGKWCILNKNHGSLFKVASNHSCSD